MALIKEIEEENGIKLSYHRVYSINNITNMNTIIEVKSYLSKEDRILEKEQNKSKYTVIKSYTLDYDDDFKTEDAYEYLKTLDEYEGAIDDIEEYSIKEETVEESENSTEESDDNTENIEENEENIDIVEESDTSIDNIEE